MYQHSRRANRGENILQLIEDMSESEDNELGMLSNDELVLSEDTQPSNTEYKNSRQSNSSAHSQMNSLGNSSDLYSSNFDSDFDDSEEEGRLDGVSESKIDKDLVREERIEKQKHKNKHIISEKKYKCSITPIKRKRQRVSTITQDEWMKRAAEQAQRSQELLIKKQETFKNYSKSKNINNSRVYNKKQKQTIKGTAVMYTRLPNGELQTYFSYMVKPYYLL